MKDKITTSKLVTVHFKPPAPAKGEVPVITFNAEGKLWFKEGKFVFEGNAEKSAKIFFDFLNNILDSPVKKYLYRASVSSNIIDKVECLKEQGNILVINIEDKTYRTQRNGSLISYFDTWEEANKHLRYRAKKKVDAVNEELVKATNILHNLESRVEG